MGLFGSKPKEPVDDTAKRYLATAPPGARTEVLTSACFLQATRLQVAAADRRGSVVPHSELAPVDELVRATLRQDRAMVPHVARKTVLNLSVMGEAASCATFADWMVMLRGTNGVRTGSDVPLELVPGQSDPDGTGLSLAQVFDMTFRAVALGRQRATSGEWGFYSSLYTDPAQEHLAVSVIAWGSVAVARLIVAGALDRRVFPTLGDAYGSVPPLTAPGWYPHPKKSGRLPSGDAQFKCFWDGSDWTDRVRLWNGRSYDDATVPHRAAPDE
jgi:hypothetical protein